MLIGMDISVLCENVIQPDEEHFLLLLSNNDFTIWDIRV